MDVDLFIDRVLTIGRRINPKLNEYIRRTGIMQSGAVARNYLRYANWLNFLRLESSLVIPNSYTVFLADLNAREDFSLSKEEKIGFFLALIEVDDVLRILRKMEMKNSVKNSVKLLGLSEHFIESFFEWFVDLGIVRPTNYKFGTFDLTNLGYHAAESARNGRKWEASKTYSSVLLSSNVRYGLNITDDEIWQSFRDSLEKLGQHTRSEVDPNLYSAFPLVLDLQIRLILAHHLLVSTTELIQKLKDISPRYNTVFSWDPLANAGYVKV
jgi:hypothetical protein